MNTDDDRHTRDTLDFEPDFVDAPTETDAAAPTDNDLLIDWPERREFLVEGL